MAGEAEQDLQNESPKARAAFAVYRDLGPDRSLRLAARRLRKSERLLKRWSSRYNWCARAQAWDAQQRQQEREQAHSTQTEIYERRLAYAEQLEKVAMAGLRTLVIRDPDSGELRFAKGLKPTEICALVRVAQSLLPTPPPAAGLEEQGDTDAEALARLSDEDLETLLSLLEKQAENNPEAEEASDEATA